jgi:hypothetical protein
MEQFLHHPIDDRDEIIEAYLIGSRLAHFLSAILPTHPEYFSQKRPHESLRNHAQAQLSELTGYVEVLAILLDKQEHERYISYVLEDEHGAQVAGNVVAGDASESNGDALREEWTMDEGTTIATHPPRLSKPPLACQSVSSSSFSDRNPVSHDHRAVTRNDYPRRSPYLEGRSMEAYSNDGPNEELDEVSASLDSTTRPLLMHDEMDGNLRGHRVDGRNQWNRFDEDWDMAWVKRHDHRATTMKVASHSVFDQESSVANVSINTEATSHLDPSTVDSSLMNPPEPIYQPLMETETRQRRTHRKGSTKSFVASAVAPASITDAIIDASSSHRSAWPPSPDESLAAAHPVDGKIPLDRHQQGPTKLFRDAHFESDQRQGNELLGDNGSFEFDYSKVEPRNSSLASLPVSTSKLDTRNSNRRESTNMSSMSSQQRQDESLGQISNSWGNRISTFRDVLEDPKQRWFGNDESVSNASNESNDGPLRLDPFDGYFPFEREQRSQYAKKGNNAVDSSGTRSFSCQSRLKSAIAEPVGEAMAISRCRSQDQEVDCSQESANRKYVPGSIREKATRRLTAKAQIPARDEVFTELECEECSMLHASRQSTKMQRNPVSILKVRNDMRGNPPEFVPGADQLASARSHVNVANDINKKITGENDSGAEGISSRSQSESGNADLSHRPQSRLMVSMTVDGKECAPAPIQPLVPSHRQSAVRASAERLKALRSRRLDHRFPDKNPLPEQFHSIYKMSRPPGYEDSHEEASRPLVDEREPRKNRGANTSHVEANSRSVKPDAIVDSNQIPSTPGALPSSDEDLFVDAQVMTQSEQNMSIENDPVLNGEVEQILARESTMVRSTYESFHTGSGSENDDLDVDPATGANVQAADGSEVPAVAEAQGMDDSSDKCYGDDEGSEFSACDPFSLDDTSAPNWQADFRKRHEVLIEAMRLEQRTYLDSSPPRAFERRKLMPSSRDMYFQSRRKSQAHFADNEPSAREPRCEPVDLDETVDDDEAGKVITGLHEGASVSPSQPSLSVVSSAVSKTRIEYRLEEASKTSSQVPSPTSVLIPVESRAGDVDDASAFSVAKRVTRTKTSVASGATSLGTFGEDDDDTAMVNAFLVRKRRPLSHFRGCVRFLLE